MTPSQQTSLQVLDTIDLLVRLWNRGDIPGILSHADPECSGFGPGAGDRFRGTDEFRKFLDAATLRVVDLGLTGVRVDATGTISWVSGSFDSTCREGSTSASGRFTAVLKGTGHAWVLVQLHLSYPHPVNPAPG